MIDPQIDSIYWLLRSLLFLYLAISILQCQYTAFLVTFGCEITPLSCPWMLSSDEFNLMEKGEHRGTLAIMKGK
jgi:hypothetical protein